MKLGQTRFKLPSVLLRRTPRTQGNIFIDRDPKHFGLIVNYLRDGFVVMPRGEESLREIMVEAAHYKARRALLSVPLYWTALVC